MHTSTPRQSPFSDPRAGEAAKIEAVMATAAKVVYSHITKQPGVRGGKACIDDTRIAVADVVVLLDKGLGDQQIVECYPSLNLAQVHAAISYYYENRQELQQDLAEDDDAEAENERRRAEYLSRRTP
jgi:uncharacterized protein (DUF433 family)